MAITFDSKLTMNLYMLLQYKMNVMIICSEKLNATALSSACTA